MINFRSVVKYLFFFSHAHVTSFLLIPQLEYTLPGTCTFGYVTFWGVVTLPRQYIWGLACRTSESYAVFLASEARAKSRKANDKTLKTNAYDNLKPKTNQLLSVS